jgi:hypothetical protein
MKRKDAINAINDNVSEKLTELGFKQGKDNVTWKRSNDSFSNELLFLLKENRDGSVSQHIKAGFTDLLVEKTLMEVEGEVRLMLGLPELKIKRGTCEITDWKEILEEEDNPIWLTNFSSEMDILENKKNYLNLIEKANKWFETINSVDEIKKYCLNSGFTMSLAKYLIITKVYEKTDTLKEYDFVIQFMGKKKGWNKEELKVFSEFINNI